MFYDYSAYYAFVVILVFFVFFISAVVYVWSSIALMSVLKKANHPQPWAAWIPFYRDFVFFETGGQTGWFMFLSIASSIVLSISTEELGARWFLTLLASILVSGAAAVFWVFAIVNINKAFAKPVLGFTILAVLLPLIWLSILAWDRSVFAAHLATGPHVPGKGGTFLEQQRELVTATASASDDSSPRDPHEKEPAS